MSVIESEINNAADTCAMQRALGLATSDELTEEKNIPNVIFGTSGAIVVLPSPVDSIEDFVIAGQQGTA